MPHIVDQSGVVRYLPGAYGSIRVRSDSPGPLPDFLVPVIIGQADQGIPQGVGSDSLRLQSENASPWREVETTGDAAAIYGPDSEIAVAMAYAKRHGLPRAFVIAANSLTRGTGIATSGSGPKVNQAYIRPALWGAGPGWTKIKWASNVWSVQRPARFTLLTAAAGSGATRLYVKDNSWAVAGMGIEVGDNATANAAATILAVGTEYTATGQVKPYIDLTAGTSAALAITAYAGVALYDVSIEAISGLTTFDAWLAAVNTTGAGGDFAAVVHASSTGVVPSAVASFTAYKDITAWDTITPGTNPALTTTNITDLITALDATLWVRFVQDFGVIPRAYFLASSNATNHATLRDYAIAQRVAGFPISVVAGCAWGDTSTSASDSTSAKYRTASLNCQDFVLVANGHNKLGSYLSTAAAVWGLQVAGGIGHNLTNDVFVGVTAWETQWSRTQEVTLVKAGVVTNKLTSNNGIQWAVNQGLNTLQANNGLVWNIVDSTTWSVMQRDLMDFIQYTLKIDFETAVVGADAVQAASVAGVLQRRASKSFLKRNLITAFRINSIARNDEASGWNVDWDVTPIGLTDYVSFRTTILVA